LIFEKWWSKRGVGLPKTVPTPEDFEVVERPITAAALDRNPAWAQYASI
jgi:hypothetical protein